MKTRRKKLIAVILLALLVFDHVAFAEISGSGSPNSGCLGQISGLLWQDLNRNGVVDFGEPALTNVDIDLVSDDEGSTLGATTNSTGYYEFEYLCEGEYLAVIDEATVPEGMIAPDLSGNSSDEPSDDELGGWLIEIGDDDDELTATVSLGFVGCDVRVSASCTVASLATELYSCEKPIDKLSLIWAGHQEIRVVAHYGKRDDPVVADIDDIAPGDRVSISGFAGSPDDVTWEIFVAGTDTKIGESRFRMNCDDEAMNGPEDCGVPQGDGRDNKSDRINDWLLDGIVDDSGLMECTNINVASDTCESQSAYADCEILDKVRWLTFSYTGGVCDASVQDQPDKFQCTGNVDVEQAITVQTESGDSFTVEPGGSFTIPAEGGDTDIELSNDYGTQSMRIHTSCSEPLAAGDVFGSLTVAALNGIGLGAQIDYEYALENKNGLAAIAFTRETPMRTLFEPIIAIDGNTTRTVAGSAYVMRTSAGAVLAESTVGSNAICNGADLVNIIISPRLPCEISGSGWQIHDDHILFYLGTGPEVSATIERIEISWPTSVTDKLKEIKLNGDKIFDQDRYGGVTTINRADLIGELHKRQISRNDSKELKIVFDDHVDDLSPEDFDLEIQFRQGCAISW